MLVWCVQMPSVCVHACVDEFMSTCEVCVHVQYVCMSVHVLVCLYEHMSGRVLKRTQILTSRGWGGTLV